MDLQSRELMENPSADSLWAELGILMMTIRVVGTELWSNDECRVVVVGSNNLLSVFWVDKWK